jgi:hypothetical protein
MYTNVSVKKRPVVLVRGKARNRSTATLDMEELSSDSDIEVRVKANDTPAPPLPDNNAENSARQDAAMETEPAPATSQTTASPSVPGRRDAYVFFAGKQCCGSGIRCLFEPWIRDPG